MPGMARGRPLTPLRAVVLIVVIGLAAWMQWRGVEPASAPVPGPASTASPTPTPPAASPAAYDLAHDEGLGGHTISRHVGRSDDQLRERLKRESGITAASTYTDQSTAERVVAETLNREQRRVDAWAARQGNRPNLALDYRGTSDRVIGRSMRRGRSSPDECVDAVVVLRSLRDGRFIVLTSYPEVR